MPPLPALDLAPPPTLAVDGTTQPGLTQALLRWHLTERSRQAVAGEAELDDAGGAWGDGAVLRVGAALTLMLGDETLLDGRVTALERRVAEGAAPTLAAVLAGRRPRAPAPPAGAAPPVLRVGVHLLQAQARRAAPTAPVQLVATLVDARWATGSQALRVGALVQVEGLGALFDGAFRLQEVVLRGEPATGLRVALAGRRS